MPARVFPAGLAVVLVAGLLGCGDAADDRTTPTTRTIAVRPYPAVGAASDPGLPLVDGEMDRALSALGAPNGRLAVRSARATVGVARSVVDPATTCFAAQLRGDGELRADCVFDGNLRKGSGWTARPGGDVVGVVPDGTDRVAVTDATGRTDRVRAQHDVFVAAAPGGVRRIRWTSPATGPVDFRAP